MVGTPPKPAIERLRAELPDGRRVSTLWFRMPHRRHKDLLLLPVSAGCELRARGEERGWRTGCKFCTVGRGPFEGYLSPEQMLGFARLALGNARLAADYWERGGGNLVVFFSSAGEPLLHYKAVAAVIRKLKSLFGHKLFVSISTSGVAAGIKELLDDTLKIQLRLSLHFATDEDRKAFMPVQDDIATLLDLGVKYAKRSGIPLMVKYVLIGGVNDSDEHARRLASVLQPYRDHIWVRVSRLNPYGGDLKAPSNKRRNCFRAILIRAGFRTVQVWKGFATLGCDEPHYAN
ncbi:radical SAM protein [Patescibacteria group bacterium]|nr:radical SAM protein [Patescibacteria group bacterium]